MSETPKERHDDEYNGEDTENDTEYRRREHEDEEGSAEGGDNGEEDNPEADNEQLPDFIDIALRSLEDDGVEADEMLEAMGINQEQHLLSYLHLAYWKAAREEEKRIRQWLQNEQNVDADTAGQLAHDEIGSRFAMVYRRLEELEAEDMTLSAEEAENRALQEVLSDLTERAAKIASRIVCSQKEHYDSLSPERKADYVQARTRTTSGDAYDTAPGEYEPEEEADENETEKQRLNPFVARARKALETDAGREAAQDKEANKLAASGVSREQFISEFEPEAFNRALDEEEARLTQQYKQEFMGRGVKEADAERKAQEQAAHVMRHGVEKGKAEERQQRHIYNTIERLRREYIDQGMDEANAAQRAANKASDISDAVAKKVAQEIAQEAEKAKRERIQRMTQRAKEISEETLVKLKKAYGADMGSDQMRVTATRASLLNEFDSLREKYVDQGMGEAEAAQKAADKVEQNVTTFDQRPRITETQEEADFRARLQMQEEAASFIAEGLVYPEQIVAWRKGNSKRADIAAPGFPYQLGELAKAVERHKAGHQVMTEDEAREWRGQFVQNAQFGAMLAGRPEAIHTAALAMRQQIEQAFKDMRKNGNDSKLQEELARFRAVHKLAGQVNKDAADRLRKIISSVNVPLDLRTSYKDPETGEGLSFMTTNEQTGRPGPMSIGDMADMYEAEPRIGRIMYELTPSFYSAYQQQHQAEMAREQAEQEARRMASQGSVASPRLGL